MKDTCWKPFGFLVMDHREAQEFLNSMAAQGWEMADFRFGMLKFRRTERTDLRYFIDWTDPRKGEEEDYLQLCEEAGWELRESLGYWNLFASKPGTRPAPIQTDRSLEYERYRKKVLRRMLLGAVPSLLLALMVAVLVGIGGIAPLLLSGNLMVLFVLASPLLLLAGVVYVGYSLSRLLAWKRALDVGAEPSSPAPGWRQFWFGCRVLGRLYSSVLFVALLADMLLNDAFSGVHMVVFGFAILYNLTQDMERRPNATRHWGSACLVIAVVVLCFFARGPVRDAFLGRVPQWPILENAWLDPGGSFTISPERRDTLLGSSAHWVERISSQPDPDSSISEDMLRMEVQVWATSGLAERAFEEIPAEMEPLAGYEGIWVLPNGYGSVDYLVRRGRVQARFFASEGVAEEALPAVLEWLKGVE